MRAVLAYHEAKRARLATRFVHRVADVVSGVVGEIRTWFEPDIQLEPTRLRLSRERLAKRVDRAGAGETRRSRLVSAAADYGANVYSSSDGSLAELEYFLSKDLPVIVGRFESGRQIDPAITGAQRVIGDSTSYGIVTRIDNARVSVLLPHEGLRGVEVESRWLPRDEFETDWRISDSHSLQEANAKATTPADIQHLLKQQQQVSRWYMVLNTENKRFEPAFQKGHDHAPPLLDLRRKRRVLTAAWSIFLAELVLGGLSYADPSSYVFALISMGLAVLGFTAIDYFARPEQREYTGTLIPRWYRRHLPFWCLVPFLTALGGSVWVHYQKWAEARIDVHQLAREIKIAVEREEPPPVPPTPPPPVEPPNPQEPPKEQPKPTQPVVEPPKPPVVKPPEPGALSPAPRDPEIDACVEKAKATSKLATDVLVGRRPPPPSTPVPDERVDQVIARLWAIAALAEWVEAREGIERQNEIRLWECFTTERVYARVTALLANRYQDQLTSDEATRFGQIARVVGHDIMLAKGDVTTVCDRAQRDTAAAFALSLGVQALFILWIPALLAVTIARARKRTNRDHLQDDVANSMNLRDHAILAEDQYLFMPRMCFALLLVLGTNYVFAPLGLKSTYIMTLVNEHALPGHTTFTLWTTSFAEAPVLVVGFVGFLLYALITATQRFAQDDFDDRSLLALLVRGLVVILLSFALSSSEMNEFASRTFVFIAGVFPIRALEAMAKKVNVTIDPDFATVPESSFIGLPGLDPVKVFALRTAGIQSTYDLAAMNIKDVAERVRIDPRLLGRSVDRAILIDALGPTLAERLTRYGITSATELVAATPDLQTIIAPGSGPDAAELATLQTAATLTANRLAADARVVSVRGWLASR